MKKILLILYVLSTNLYPIHDYKYLAMLFEAGKITENYKLEPSDNRGRMFAKELSSNKPNLPQLRGLIKEVDFKARFFEKTSTGDVEFGTLFDLLATHPGIDKQGKIKLLNDILKKQEVFPNHYNYRGQNTLHHMAFLQDKGLYEKFLNNGSKEIQWENGLTTLHSALLAHDVDAEFISYLLTRDYPKSYINAEVMIAIDSTARYFTPLQLTAFLHDNGQVVQSLVKAEKIEIDKLNSANKNSALHIAVNRGHLNAVKALLDAGANVNVESVGRWTPLHVVSINAPDWYFSRGSLNYGSRNKKISNAREIAEVLLKKGAKINAKIQDRNSSERLESADLRKNSYVQKDRTPLHLALFTENFNVAKSLIKNKAKMELRDALGKSPSMMIKEIRDKSRKSLQELNSDIALQEKSLNDKEEALGKIKDKNSAKAKEIKKHIKDLKFGISRNKRQLNRHNFLNEVIPTMGKRLKIEYDLRQLKEKISILSKQLGKLTI